VRCRTASSPTWPLGSLRVGKEIARAFEALLTGAQAGQNDAHRAGQRCDEIEIIVKELFA
jgi:hypothetical protein